MITIVDYGVGNLASVQNMLKRCGIKTICTSSVERSAHENMNTNDDTSRIKKISGSLEIPLVVCGGAFSVQVFCEAVRAGASCN